MQSLWKGPGDSFTHYGSVDHSAVTSKEVGELLKEMECLQIISIEKKLGKK